MAELFLELMNLYEFEVYKTTNKDGKSVLKLEDLQGGNLGDIESEEFEDCTDIIERMELYHDDYIVTPLCDYLYATYKIDVYNHEWSYILDECKKHCDKDIEWDLKMLDIIVNPNKLKGVRAYHYER